MRITVTLPGGWGGGRNVLLTKALTNAANIALTLTILLYQLYLLSQRYITWCHAWQYVSFKMLLTLLAFLSCIAFVHVSYKCGNCYLLPLHSETCGLPHITVVNLWASHTAVYPHSCCARVSSPCCGLSHIAAVQCECPMLLPLPFCMITYVPHIAVVHMWIPKITTIGGLPHTAVAHVWAPNVAAI